MKPIQPASRNEWNAALSSLPYHHLLQSWEWGLLKEIYGWRAERLLWRDADGTPVACAQVLERTLRIPVIGRTLRVLYCPRGPVLDWSQPARRDQILHDLTDHAQSRHALFLKIDPQLPLAVGFPDDPEEEQHERGLQTRALLRESGWIFSPDQIQFRNTLTLDLDLPEDELLANMKQKTRYNVRLAGRRGVQVRRGGIDDLELLYQMYAETSVRDGFVIREREYYEDAWGSFITANMAQPLIASVEGEPIAALVAYRFGQTATYMYGMSRELHREKMPNYLLQWEAIRWAKGQSCKTYDFWGAPDRLDESDPMWGVYRFKSGFGADLIRTIGAWDLPLNPLTYRLYHLITPLYLAVMRWRGHAETQRQLEQ
jgi:lipid II:glycine glycyltransferase (peptidoglycan interpeptide bridge formation enzyme)